MFGFGETSMKSIVLTPGFAPRPEGPAVTVACRGRPGPRNERLGADCAASPVNNDEIKVMMIGLVMIGLVVILMMILMMLSAVRMEDYRMNAPMSTRILIVEDDPDIAQLVARYLDKAGFVTDHAAT